jgi:uncharacterized membrane protein YbhN (UPF0104 family)
VRPILKRTLHWGGSAVAIAGIVFVALRLYGYGAEIDFARFDLMAWSWVAALALIYGLSNLMLALAWWNLLGQFGARTSRRWAVRVYGISQIAKYVPGNIFHLAGRQAMGMAAGLAGWPLAKSAVWELGLISVAGGLFGLLALPLLLPHMPVMAGAGIFAAALGIAALLLKRYVGPPVARAFGWHAAFLALSGLLFVGLIELLAGSGSEGLLVLPVIGAYVLAWLAGLVTPGAPAGLGVRELVLLFLLNGVIGEADLLLAAVLGRVVTVCGDVGFFAVASLINFRTTIFEEP